ncbi:MAG: hypothetical protein ABNH21_05185 [Glaciecola sp.]|jgi:hypothetical protein
MRKNKELMEFFHLKRTTKGLKRIHKKRHKKLKYSNNRFIGSRQKHLKYFYESSPERKLLFNRKSKKNRELIISIPSTFSLYENPNDVLDVISKIASVQKDKTVKSIFIDHSKCKKNGLGSEVLLASVVSCLDKVKCNSGMRFNVRGQLPEEDALARMISAIGVVKDVLKKDIVLEKDKNAKTLVFRSESIPKEKIDNLGGDKKNQTCASFLEYFNNCLFKADRVLSGTGKQSLNEYTGEILDNAARHSGTNMWHIYMYMDYTNDDILNVHIVVYSLGRSIYETFLLKKEVDEVWSQVENYIAAHKTKFDESDLVTVMAMQQTITSKKDEDRTGGLGTVNFINFFETVNQECHDGFLKPQMTIISGQTQLKFDGKIEMYENEDGINLISFNDSGSLEDPPSNKYVKNLGDRKFPGVLVSIKFPIKNDSEMTNDNRN